MSYKNPLGTCPFSDAICVEFIAGGRDSLSKAHSIGFSFAMTHEGARTMAGRGRSFRKPLAYRVGNVKLGHINLFYLMTFYDFIVHNLA